MMRCMVVTAWACAAVVACSGGGNDDASSSTQAEPAAQPPQPVSAPAAGPSANVATTYAPSLNVDLARMTRSETGLYTQDLKVGTGDPVLVGQTAVVHYTGWLPDGTKFDSSRDRGEPFPVQLGENRVIAGWEQGLQGLRPGGRRLLVIPPDLAYGPEGRPPVIPGGATLVFDVELVEIR